MSRDIQGDCMLILVEVGVDNVDVDRAFPEAEAEFEVRCRW